GVPLAGHFHAAAFSYRPLQRGPIELNASIKPLFEGQALEGILHLLTDDRAISGAGASEFVRGASLLWPICTNRAGGACGVSCWARSRWGSFFPSLRWVFTSAFESLIFPILRQTVPVRSALH